MPLFLSVVAVVWLLLLAACGVVVDFAHVVALWTFSAHVIRSFLTFSVIDVRQIHDGSISCKQCILCTSCMLS